MHPQKPASVLPFIVVAQFACTSVWFAGNAVIGDMMHAMALPASMLGHLSAAVQLGFISGTLVFAILSIADRFSPSRVFLICAMAAAMVNATVLFLEGNAGWVIGSRFTTGFFLAGIYPVGMKIASDHHRQGLGKALGWLVGALVLGTAFPHLMHVFTAALSWKWVISISSFLSMAGGMLIALYVPDGPYRAAGNGFHPLVLFSLFRNKDFRAAAAGYFGHMWELYAFWTFVPVIWSVYLSGHRLQLSVPFLSFLVIAAGALACIAGGYIAHRYGSARTAFFALLFSFTCCMVSPLFFQLPFVLFFVMMLLWGMTVVADSPQFSTLVAGSIPAAIRGTALTLTNCIGFAITILSIETLNFLRSFVRPEYLYLILAIGPATGLVLMRSALKPRS